MKIKWNRLTVFSVSLVFFFCMSWDAYAHEVPDMDRLCSVTLMMREGDNDVPGGSLTIYRVGEVVEEDGNFTFRLTGDFTGCGESLEALNFSAEMAVRLQAYTEQQFIAGLVTKHIDDQGKVTFDSLQVGLYLFVQHDAASGYEKISPFMVSLPYLENGTYRYDLTAEPKTELEKEPGNPLPDNPPDTSPEAPPDNPPALPETGQLWWPVPVLACAGLLFFAAGIILNRRKDLDEDEKIK